MPKLWVNKRRRTFWAVVSGMETRSTGGGSCRGEDAHRQSHLRSHSLRSIAVFTVLRKRSWAPTCHNRAADRTTGRWAPTRRASFPTRDVDAARRITMPPRAVIHRLGTTAQELRPCHQDQATAATPDSAVLIGQCPALCRLRVRATSRTWPTPLSPCYLRSRR